MTDIDFDELDRAVNSLVNPDAKPVPGESPLVPAVAPTAASAPVASNPAPLAERRSSGRFMDVVHPSSDMRSSVPDRPASREAATIAPVLTTPSASIEAPKPATSWPDPIDMHEATQEKAITALPVPEPPKDSNGPLESPFLTDAKVEKRPLGAFSNESRESEPTPSISAATTPSTPELTMDTTDTTMVGEKASESSDQPVVNDTPMPAELQPGLLSIESNEDPKIAKEEPIVPAGPTSITQQYTQQPSTGDKPVANMFDTAAYKKPKAAAGKKKSGWLIVLWIFLLIVVGAGVGAAVYFFVLPRL
ncbi:hypothetical protein BH10PAT4_BH10PAT4_2890 [soil metagenome]